MGSISSTFYVRIFHTKVLCTDFLYLRFGVVTFWRQIIGKKCLCKMLVKFRVKQTANKSQFHQHSTYLCAASTHVAPKSVRIQSKVSIFLCFWDLRVQKLLTERWWNWHQEPILLKKFSLRKTCLISNSLTSCKELVNLLFKTAFLFIGLPPVLTSLKYISRSYQHVMLIFSYRKCTAYM